MKNATIFLLGIVIIFSAVGLPIMILINPTIANRQQVLVDVIQQVKPSVVHVKCPEWQGSGFIVSEHLIVTARHVVDGVEDFEITFDCGNKVKAYKAISSKDHDIAFIWVEEPMPKALVLSSIKGSKLGEVIFAIGSPFGINNFNSVTQGILSAERRDFDSGYTSGWGWSTLFQTDTNGEGGNSGCPLFNTKGEVIGVLVGGMSNGIIYCVPSDVFMNDLDMITLMFNQNNYYIETIPDNSFNEMYEWYQDNKNDYRLDEIYEWYSKLKLLPEKLQRFISLLMLFGDVNENSPYSHV